VLSTTRTALVAMLALAFVPATVLAQEPAPAQPQASPELQGWVAEMQQLQAELAPVQAQALEADPALQEEQEQVSAAVQQAMLEIDPALPERQDRIAVLQEEARAAQEAGDVDRIIELSGEAEQIQQSFADAQMQAMQREDIAPQVEAFQTRLQARMMEIDPATETRMQRLQELERQIETSLRRSQG